MSFCRGMQRDGDHPHPVVTQVVRMKYYTNGPGGKLGHHSLRHALAICIESIKTCLKEIGHYELSLCSSYLLCYNVST